MAGFGSILEGATDFLSEQGAEAAASTGTELTRVVASFHSDDGFDGLIDSRPSKKPFRIVGFLYQKSFGSAGRWTLTVKPSEPDPDDSTEFETRDLFRLWDDPEDVWVRISVVKNGVSSETLLGLIDTITESTERAPDGSRSAVYQIQGSDFQKVFESTFLFVNIYEGLGTLPAIPLFSAAPDLIAGPPDALVRAVIESWLGNNGIADKQWKLPESLGGGYFFDLLRLDFDRALKGHLYDPAILNPDTWQGKNLWSTLQEYSNGLLNEMFATLTMPPGTKGVYTVPTLILRERPFPTDSGGRRRYDALKTHELRPIDIQGRQLSRGAPESRFNYWLIDGLGWQGTGASTQYNIQAEAKRTGGIPGSAPIYSAEEIRRHGLRFWNGATRYLPWREDANWLKQSADWLHMIHDWYVISPYELTGAITTTSIKPMIRIGQRVKEFRRNGHEVTYYVEGVTHQWQYPGAGSSQLHVTHGEYQEDDLLKLAYKRTVLTRAQTALETALRVADTVNKNLGSPIPFGSPMTLDKTVGQPPNVERLYLEQRGKLAPSERRARGEPGRKPQERTRFVGDLADRTVSDETLAAVGRLPPQQRVPGNLTQRELERGVRLPVRDPAIDPEPTTVDSDTFRQKQHARAKLRQRRARG